jgi:hypothetical protein
MAESVRHPRPLPAGCRTSRMDHGDLSDSENASRTDIGASYMLGDWEKPDAVEAWM